MPTPKRRSARLAATETVASPSFTTKLGSLVEREETPRKKESSLNAMISPGGSQMPGAFIADDELKTPETSGRLHPGHAEMHPSKAQQSTTKAPDSGLRLGFADINENEDSSTKVIESTPSKSKIPSSPRFNFKWSRPESDLSSEAQRIMESVRVEAAKIKEKMQAEREQQALKDGQASSGILGRKFAKPKSRFSDIHQAEFKKMDSIANHVSLWKTKIQTASSQGLKRTKSRADLTDDVEQDLRQGNDSPRPSGKRVKTRANADVSSARQVTGLQTPKRSVGKTGVMGGTPSSLPTFITTPTKASAARAASVKPTRTSKFPSLVRSRSSKSLTSSAPPKTEGNNKYFSALSRAPGIKSILHRSQPKFSDDPSKIAAGTHLPASKGLDAEKDLPGLISTAKDVSPQKTPSIKRVGFKLDHDIGSGIASNSPSPSKIPSKATGITGTPVKRKDDVVYPKLPKHVPGPLSSNPPGPGDFTFRSNKTVKFGPDTARLKQPTIRQVRPSGVATPASGFVPLPSVPHGVPNKKRRRVEDDDSVDDVESSPQKERTILKSPAKRQRTQTTPAFPARDVASPNKRATSSKTAEVSKKKKGGLSLARLNMLARPKTRN